MRGRGESAVAERLRIIIVEDDAIIAMDLKELLIGMGYDVRAIAYTEQEAVSAAWRCDPGLMIVDGNLAEGSGMSAMKQILKRRFVPHLYITGDPQRVLELAPNAVIVAKPFNHHGLAAGITVALAKASTLVSKLPQPNA
jgi:DNA-binding response OmpR family regulator